MRTIVSIAAVMFAFANAAHADIYQWEYIDPNDPSQGKQQSTTLAPDGAGVDAVPGASLGFRNLTMAYLVGADLTGASGYYVNLADADMSLANLTNADFSADLFFDGFGTYVIQSDLTSADLRQANLRSANFTGAILTDANFRDADVRGTKFGKSLVYYQSNTLYGTGITPAQLYSSASYHAKDLSDIGLEYHNLADVNFAGQNLTNTSFRYATLTSADFNDANLTGADLISATLTSANLTQAYLNNASLVGATLTGVDFTNARIQGANLTGATSHGFTAAQLYSTYSYEARNLTGVCLMGNNHAGWNFASQNMANAKFNGTDLTGSNLRRANLTNADFGYVTLANAGLSQANLTNADFSEADLTGTDFSDAEIRGANFWANAPRAGITLSQLYSTASYQARDLTGVWFYGNNLSGGNFVGQDLTNVFFDGATLTGADFADSLVRGAIFAGTTGDGFTAAQLYSTASYRSHDLTRINLGFNDLSGWNFAGQNLTDADFYLATLTGADFTDAKVRGAIFIHTTNHGFTAAQLYSTASYVDHDLAGTDWRFNNLSGWNFAGQDLSNTSFYSADLTDANFTDAKICGASFWLGGTGTGITLSQLYSTASYRAYDLTGISLSFNNLAGGNFAGQNFADAEFEAATLTNANFQNANLTNAFFRGAMLTGADFTGAEVRGANFLGTGITLAQLYSTGSYEAKELSGIGLGANNLTGGNFAGQNITHADFAGGNLTDANFRHANLANANFFAYYNDGSPQWATLTGADFTAADARGSDLSDYCYYTADVITTNLIRPDGHIRGLDLNAGDLHVLRDYEWVYDPAYPAFLIPITIDQHLAMGPGGTLRMVFEADAWDSTISFAPGIPVTLGGTLELTFADDVNPASQLGRTLDLFDWTGVNPTGAFAISSPYAWNLSNLYTTGEVTLTAIPEPSTLALLLLACGPLLIPHRRGMAKTWY